MLIRLLVILALCPLALLAAPPQDAAPPLPDGTEAARKQMAAFRLPAGMQIELFAAEPKLASPVAIGLDERGRVYVAEEHRFNAGTEENRTRAFLLEDDLQVRTLDDRFKMFKKWETKFDGGMGWFTKHADQIRLLDDSTGSGRADKSTILAQFREPLDGLAAGVLAIDGDVYITCIPNLWVLKKGATQPTPLLTGFGVNAAFLGHDLHGLCRGPDGKLYFSVGDRGFHVTSKEGTTFSGPRTGAVFRCNLDGTEFEVVHRGLRNPQELAFDQYGNLFADDNNCDKGDHARLVYIVEGGESGWNMAYQSITPHTTAPWFAERLWHLQHPGQAAYIVPPVGKIGTGPSGFLFTSGTSLPDRYKNSFLMCNYTGHGGLESFKVKPIGAGFEIEDYHDFLKPIMATDAEFGYDGKLYVSDFVNLDWSGKSLGGRIYTLFDPKKLDSDVVRETKKLFKEGFNHRSDDELGKLLGHLDQRVRLRAQFELATPHRHGEATFLNLLPSSKDPLQRIHCIWGLGQIARRKSELVEQLANWLNDSDSEVRAQTAKVIAESVVKFGTGRPSVSKQSAAQLATALVARLTDSNARVRFFAAQSLGKLKAKTAIDPLFEAIRQNKDADPYLRHACVVALERIGDTDAVAAKANDASASVRLAVVLVQRRLKDPRIANALDDPEVAIRTEAARAIHDLPIDELMPQLAALLPKLGDKPIPDGDPLVRRCISAAYRLGGTNEAKAVLAVAMNANSSMIAQSEALSAIADWADPPPRDRVTGFWRPLPKRDATGVRQLLQSQFQELLTKIPSRLHADLITAIRKLDVQVEPSQFILWAGDKQQSHNLRIAALRLLANQKSNPKSKELETLLTNALVDSAPGIRAEARELIAKDDPKRAIILFEAVLSDESSAILERQRAMTQLAKLKTPEAGRLLDAWVDKLARGQVPKELQLELLEAVQSWPSPEREANRAQFEKRTTGKFRVSLAGGDADRGRDIFFNHASAQCARCHTVRGSGGTAGPELTKVAEKYGDNLREHALESMIQPSAKLAEGFATITLTLVDGRVIAGTLIREDKERVMVRDTNGQPITIEAADIESRTKPTSAMPSVENTLTPREVRDLVEYLSTLK